MNSSIVSLSSEQARCIADLLDDYPETVSIDVSEDEQRSLRVVLHNNLGESPASFGLTEAGTLRNWNVPPIRQRHIA